MSLRPLLPHQRTAFQLHADKDRLAAFMEMRLGKSLLAIRWLNHRHREKGLPRPRNLLVAPSTPLVGWSEELEREGEDHALAVGSRKARVEAAALGKRWTLVNYASLLHTPELRDVEWTSVVLDESTAIKNPKARTTKLLFDWFCRRRLPPLKAVLTGMPTPQSIFEIWTQLAWLFDGRWMGHNNFWSWRGSIAYPVGYEWVVPTTTIAKIKEQAHRDAYFLRRRDVGVGSMKVRQKLAGELTPSVRKLYRQVARDWEIPGKEAKHPIVVVNWLRQLAGGFVGKDEVECWKYDQLRELIVDGDLRAEQVVVWFAFNRELARAWRLLKAAGVDVTWVHGKVPVPERKRRVALFRQGRRRVFLAQALCARFGLDLSSADTAIYFSRHWSFETNKQSGDRLIHPTKTQQILELDLVTSRTTDEDVLEVCDEREVDAGYFARKVMENRRLG